MNERITAEAFDKLVDKAADEYLSRVADLDKWWAAQVEELVKFIPDGGEDEHLFIASIKKHVIDDGKS